MKKFFIFSFIGSFLFGSIAFGEAVLDSGIDPLTSTVTINFTTEDLSAYPNLENPSFTCFGATTLPIVKTFTELGITNPADLQFIINDCFRQAGTYTVSFTVYDNAGNYTDSADEVFTIKASNPDPTKITHTTTYSGSTPSLANGVDTTTYTLTLKDFADNPVTQITDIADITVPTYVISEGGEPDANLGTLFSSGLKNTLPAKVIEPAQIQLSFSSTAPTVKKVGDYLSEFTNNWLLDFTNFKSTSIREDGGKTDIMEVDIDPITNPLNLSFSPLFEIEPGANIGIDGNDSRDQLWVVEKICTGTPTVCTYNGNASDMYFKVIGTVPDEVSGFTFDVFNADSYLEYETESGDKIDSFSVEADTSIYDWHFDIGGDGTKHIAKTPLFTRTLALDDSYPLSLYIEGEYTIGTDTIRYPMGGSGFDDADICDPTNTDPCDPETQTNTINLANRNNGDSGIGTLGYNTIGGGAVPRIGADIVGQIQGKIYNRDTSTSSILVGNTDTSQDIRTKMVENAVRLIRNAKDECKKTVPLTLTTETLKNLFIDNTDDSEICDVVIVQESDVILSEGTDIELPSGQRTLIILNGNLIIASNLGYTTPTEDSFGFMLINAPVTAYPEKGNIFIRPNVQTLVGNFFAEGTFATNPGDTIETANSGLNENQLYLKGTLFTKNTLGGSKIAQLTTPWGEIPNEGMSTPVWTSALTGLQLSQIYDLHLVRTGNDYPIEGLDNNNAFVIKTSTPPTDAPPGFTNY